MGALSQGSSTNRAGYQSPSEASVPLGSNLPGIAGKQQPAKSFSLTRRIIAAVVTCQLLLTIGLVAVAVLFARAQLRASFNRALEGDAMSTLAMVRYRDRRPHILIFRPVFLPPPQDPDHPNLFEIRGGDGRLLARSPGWDAVPPAVAQSGEKFLDFSHGGTPYRAVILREIPALDSEEDVPHENVTVYFASSLAGNFRRLAWLAGYVSLSSLALLLIADSFAIWSIRRGLDPLRELAEQAGSISVRNWDFRPPSGAKMARELSPLANAIETVLARLRQSFRQQRDFTNDAAHELKTSVAILKSTLQSLLHRPRTPREYEIGLEAMVEDCWRLEDLLERMLRLARVEQLVEYGSLPKRATTELTSTCEAAIARIHAMAEERHVSLDFQGPSALNLRADPEDLELIWLNLLENAVQYSPAGSEVKIRVDADGGAVAQVSVLDSGPGIPPSELSHIFERFHRADPSRARSSGGFGLGLAICKALVDAYGGSIEAINLPDHGTEMRVRLPIT
jgi:signal transduction histidine kinase